mgnify:CR=1 FL=1
MSTALLTLLKQRFGDAVLETHQQFGDDTVVLDVTAWFDAARFLRTDPRCASRASSSAAKANAVMRRVYRRGGGTLGFIFELAALTIGYRGWLRCRVPSTLRVNDVRCGAAPALLNNVREFFGQYLLVLRFVLSVEGLRINSDPLMFSHGTHPIVPVLTGESPLHLNTREIFAEALLQVSAQTWGNSMLCSAKLRPRCRRLS